MKCKHCGHITKYKVRKEKGGRCESCNHDFAFEPKDNEHTIGDPLFDRAIQNVSSQNTLFFTPRQLWYEVERILRRKWVSGSWGVLSFAVGIGAISGCVSLSAESIIPFLIGIAIAAVLAVAGVVTRVVRGRSTPHPVMTFATFNSTYFRKWVATHGEIAKLVPSNVQQRIAPTLTDLNTVPFYELTRLPISSQAAKSIFEYRSQGQVFEKLEDLLEIPGIEASTLEVLRPLLVFPASKESTETPIEGESQDPSATPDAEFAEYSFDRALITDNAEIVDMLVANNFHFENNCALLSVDGHPPDIFHTVLEMLRRNPELKVFAVHNASAGGCSLPLTLRQEDWFPDPSMTVIDLGLLPRHAKSMRLFTIGVQYQSLSPEVKDQLQDNEVAWLEQGQSTELEVLRPSRLLRAIYQGFGQAAQAEENQDGVWGDNSSGWVYYGDYFGGDSFG